MHEYAGTGALIRLILRRDRLRLALWIVGLGVLATSSPSSVDSLYPTAEDLRAAAELMAANSAAIALQGPPLALETLGGRTVFEMGAFTFIVVALMNMFLVARHTRAEEESGRAELVRAAVVGRHATITSALAVAVGANVVVGAVFTGGLAAFDLPLAGSIVFGAAIATVGLLFAAVTAVTVQISEHTRLALGLAGVVLAAAYVLRAVGDAGTGTLSWLSPIGWGQQVRAFAGERWWVLLLPLGGAFLLVGVAFAVADRRDFGAGLVRPGPGSATASKGLMRPVGLALRLQRGSIVGWAVGLFLGGAAYGSLGSDIEDFVGDNQDIADFLAQAGGDLTDSFLATTLLILAVVGGGFAIQSMMRLRVEETSGRAEPVLATAVGRTTWVASHLVLAAVGSAVMLIAAGLGTGLTYGMSIDDLSQIPRLVVAALVHLPAMWALVGVTMLLYGLLPRFTVVAWGALAACVVISFLGVALGLPTWVRELSPFEHMPLLPAADFDVVPLVVVTAIAAALIGVGLAAFRRRDVPA